MKNLSFLILTVLPIFLLAQDKPVVTAGKETTFDKSIHGCHATGDGFYLLKGIGNDETIAKTDLQGKEIASYTI